MKKVRKVSECFGKVVTSNREASQHSGQQEPLVLYGQDVSEVTTGRHDKVVVYLSHVQASPLAEACYHVLHCSEETDCEMLSGEQWKILHQIEITL